MTRKPGEVYLVDLGMAGKVRPVVIVSREDANSPRALAVAVPLTSESRGSKYEKGVMDSLIHGVTSWKNCRPPVIALV